MKQIALLASLTLLASHAPAAADGPTGPAAAAIRAWFTTDTSLGCSDRDGNDVKCRIGPDTTFKVFYAPDKKDALVFVYYLGDPTANADSLAVMPFARSAAGAWERGKAVKNVFGHGPSAVRFSGETAKVVMETLREGDGRCCPTGRTSYTVRLR